LPSTRLQEAVGVSKVALAMFLDGNEKALRAYHAGDRTSEGARGISSELGLVRDEYVQPACAHVQRKLARL
jgi:hypothetical protein